MRIGVLSDTHMVSGKRLPSQVWETLNGVDLILHAGDLTSADFLEDLKRLAPVRAVKGNCDGPEILLPERDIVSCDGINIGLIHGHGGRRGNTPERAYLAFAGENVQVVVFGHSHSPYLKEENGVLLFNPGSPTAKRREPQFSFGLLVINGGELMARHYYF